MSAYIWTTLTDLHRTRPGTRVRLYVGTRIFTGTILSFGHFTVELNHPGGNVTIDAGAIDAVEIPHNET